MSSAGLKRTSREKPGGTNKRLGLLDDHLKEYYRRISQQLQDGFQDETQKDLFLGNVFEQLSRESIKIARNQSVSFTLEKLVHLANDKQLADLLQTFVTDWEVTLTDRFASYVLQAILYRSTSFLVREDRERFVKLLHQLSMMLLERSDLFNDTYASHVIRTLMEVLAGVKVSSELVRGRHAQKHDIDEERNMEPHDLFIEFCDVLRAFSQIVFPSSKDALQNLLTQPHTNTVAQTLLLVLHRKDPEMSGLITERISSSGYFSDLDLDGSHVPYAFTEQTSSYFVSQFLKVLKKKELTKFLQSHINEHALALALHPIGNHVLQNAIEVCQKQSQFSTLLEKLLPNIEELFANNRAGVVLKLVEVAVRYPKTQSQLLQELMSSFHCNDEQKKKHLFILLVAMATYETFSEDTAKNKEATALSSMGYLSSRILQKLFEFTDCMILVDGILALDFACHVAMASSPQGCHIYDALLNSQTVPKRSKQELAERLLPIYFNIATDKYGSRVLEAFWAVMSVPNREKLTSTLASKIKQLMNNKFGIIISSKLHLNHYLHNKPEWEAWFAAESRKRKLLHSLPDGKKKKESS